MVDEEDTDILKKIEISEEEEWDYENWCNDIEVFSDPIYFKELVYD